MKGFREFYRRHLPHFQPPGATLFITFRLAGSLPAEVVFSLREERDRRMTASPHLADSESARSAYLEQRRRFGVWDEALGRTGTGPRWLVDPRVAALVIEALHHRDGIEYDLLAFCVMPNHVHLVCTPLRQEEGSYQPLARIMQSLKRYTARGANRLLGRRGAFWRSESYDHVVRDDAELARILRYVVENPAKVGLVESWDSWPWSYLKE